MSSRGPYRRHSAQFKLQLCHDIRSGTLGRRDAQRKCTLSAHSKSLGRFAQSPRQLREGLLPWCRAPANA